VSFLYYNYSLILLKIHKYVHIFIKHYLYDIHTNLQMVCFVSYVFLLYMVLNQTFLFLCFFNLKIKHFFQNLPEDPKPYSPLSLSSNELHSVKYVYGSLNIIIYVIF
jgi:hypothetical protein